MEQRRRRESELGSGSNWFWVMGKMMMPIFWGMGIRWKKSLNRKEWRSSWNLCRGELEKNLAGSGLGEGRPFLTTFEKVRSCWREHPHLVIGPLVHANPKKLSRTSHMQVVLFLFVFEDFCRVLSTSAQIACFLRDWFVS